LSSLVKETVKAAAVIGREFELPVLTEVMRRQENQTAANSYDSKLLREQINQAEQGQIWRAMDELRYIFRHSLLREAAYDMQLRTRLRELHLLIAEAIEKIYADQIEDHYVDLAFHFENAEAKEKTREYLKKAADHSRRNYQNQQALRFYTKLLNDLELDGEVREKFHVLLRKGRVLELVGQWQTCEEVYQEAVAIASDLNEPLVQGRAFNAIGHLYMLQGRYKEARKQLEKAASVFESMEDEFGISKVYGDLGNLFFRQGDYEQAKSYFTKSIRIGRQFPYSYTQAQYVANLGLAFMNQGKYDEGIRWMEEQLERTQRKKDRQGMAILFTNLGIVYFEKGENEPAKECFMKGLELSEALGNKLLLSIASGCLGSVYERKGNYAEAQRLFELDLQLTQELGDKQGIAIAYSLLGDLYSVMGRFEEAKEQLYITLSLSEELGYQKGIARAVNTLGDIHYFTGDFPTSLQYYDRAIQVTREINNRLVLGRSLAEKCLVLLAMDNLTEARAVQGETMKIAQVLNNADLLFQAELLHARIDAAEGMAAPAIQQLLHLLEAYPDAEEQAEIYYFLEKIHPGNGYREEALRRLQELYDETPKYVFLQRLQELQPSK
jgi:tetratricopeptide (TPR) repeat protein